MPSEVHGLSLTSHQCGNMLRLTPPHLSAVCCSLRSARGFLSSSHSVQRGRIFIQAAAATVCPQPQGMLASEQPGVHLEEIVPDLTQIRPQASLLPNRRSGRSLTPCIRCMAEGGVCPVLDLENTSEAVQVTSACLQP